MKPPYMHSCPLLLVSGKLLYTEIDTRYGKSLRGYTDVFQFPDLTLVWTVLRWGVRF